MSPVSHNESSSDTTTSPHYDAGAGRTRATDMARMQSESSHAATQELPLFGRSRSASSTEPTDASQSSDWRQVRSSSPARFSVTLDRVPARSSSRPDHRNDTPLHVSDSGRRTPQLTAEGRSSPSLNVPNGSPMARQRSLDDRHRNSTSSLSQSIEIPWRQGNASRPTSPSHRIDVPRSVESGTDTDAEGEETDDSVHANGRDSLPPLPPPKETKGLKVGTRPPQLDLNKPRVEEDDGLSQGDGGELSEDFSPEEETIESTSTSTFIAPALPPIRFSMVGSDFSDILKSVTGQESKVLDGIGQGQQAALKLDVTVTPPPTAASAPHTPTNEQSDLELEVTPIQRRDPFCPRSHSPSPSLTEPSKAKEELRNGRPSAELCILRSTSSPEPREGHASKPLKAGLRQERNGSDASLAPPNGYINGDHRQARAPSPEPSKVAVRSGISDVVVRRMQEALHDSRDLGVTYVKLPTELVEATLTLLHHRQEEWREMKRKLDGVKVSIIHFRQCTSSLTV